MDQVVKGVLTVHVAAGAIALLVAPVAMVAKKGGRNHAKWGLVFFWMMTAIFVTALFLSTVKWIPFLLMIAVFSYYSVFSGYRWKFLKKLYRGGDSVQWFDWMALGLNAVFNLAFVTWGGYLIIRDVADAFPYLAMGFGFFGIRLSYVNFQLFTKPHDGQAWLYQHIGGMVGGFIATVTAFSAQTMVFLPIWLQWSWPSILGIPLVSYWIVTYRKKYKAKAL